MELSPEEGTDANRAVHGRERSELALQTCLQNWFVGETAKVGPHHPLIGLMVMSTSRQLQYTGRCKLLHPGPQDTKTEVLDLLLLKNKLIGVCEIAKPEPSHLLIALVMLHVGQWRGFIC